MKKLMMTALFALTTLTSMVYSQEYQPQFYTFPQMEESLDWEITTFKKGYFLKVNEVATSTTFKYDIKRGYPINHKIDYLFLIDQFDQDEMEENSGGSHVGNGGDVGICHTGNFRFQLMTLDFLVNNVREMKSKTTFPNLKDRDEATEYVANLLRFDARLEKAYRKFVKSYEENTLKKVRWVKWDSRLTHLDQDKELTMWSYNKCLSVIQIIKRFEENGKIAFHVDQPLLEALKKSSPLQYSILMLHEFLWFFTKEKEKVRTAAYLIHTEGFYKLKPESRGYFFRTIFDNVEQKIRAIE